MSSATGDATGAEPVAGRSLELDIGGMTCASCAARVEKRLNRVEGVSATVNYATERARVACPDSVSEQDLLAAVQRAGYSATVVPPTRPGGRSGGPDGDEEGDGPVRAARRRVLVAAALSAPVVALAMVAAWQFPYWQWLSLALATPVVAWCGLPFHRAAWTNLRHGAATMDTLVSLGTLAAFGWSLYALVLGEAGQPGMVHSFDLTVGRTDGSANLYLEVAAGVTTFILAGRYAEVRAKRRAGAALRALLELGAKDVAVLREGVERRVPADDLTVGDLFVVRPGERVATDGEVVQGGSAVDRSMLTGESVPADVGVGDAVTGGTVCSGGRIVVRATRVGSDTQLAQMARLVEQAQEGKAQVQRLADRVAGVFVPVIVAVAVATFLGWWAIGTSTGAAVTAAVAVLVVACPCALGLATPTALLVGTGRGAQLGILIKGPEVLESTRRVDTVVLDKTGTVTEGRMTLVDVVAAPDEDRDDVLRLAGAVEDASEHPIGRAVARAARERLGGLPGVGDFTGREGIGVRGRVPHDGRDVEVSVGRVAGCPGSQPGEAPADGLPDALAASVRRLREQGTTVAMVTWEGRVRGALAVGDRVRPTSRKAVSRMRDLGLEPVLLTGDDAAVARAVAGEVGIDRVVAGVLPQQKAEEVARLQREGRVVAMVGDGVNDAPALATADLGIAMGTGTDVAIEAGDLTLVRGDLLVASDAIRLSRATLATIKGNLFWAFAYNVAAVPLAAAGMLNPMIAGAAMALSSVFVVTNSLRLRRFRPLDANGAEAAEGPNGQGGPGGPDGPAETDGTDGDGRQGAARPTRSADGGGPPEAEDLASTHG